LGGRCEILSWGTRVILLEECREYLSSDGGSKRRDSLYGEEKACIYRKIIVHNALLIGDKEK